MQNGKTTLSYVNDCYTNNHNEKIKLLKNSTAFFNSNTILPITGSYACIQYSFLSTKYLYDLCDDHIFSHKKPQPITIYPQGGKSGI